MALEVAVGQFVAPTSAATNTVISGLTFQPKFVMLLASVKTTSAGFTTNNGVTVGMASGTAATAQWAFGINSADALNTSDTARVSYDGVIAIPATAGGTPLWTAKLLSIEADGFTIDWITVQATGIQCAWIALGGAEFSAEVGRFNAATALGNQIVATGIQGEALLLGNAQNTAIGGTTQMRLALGAAKSSTQRWTTGMTSSDANSKDTAQNSARVFRNEACIAPPVSSTAYDAVADFVSFNATPSFTINWTDAPSAAHVYGYAVFRGVQLYVGSSAKPTGTAPQNQDFAIGFTPKAAIVSHAELAAQTAISAGGAIMGLGVGADAGEASWWSQMADTTPTDANVRMMLTRIASKNTPPATSAAEANADFTGLADNLRLTWTPNDATAISIGILAFGDPAGGGGGGADPLLGGLNLVGVGR